MTRPATFTINNSEDAARAFAYIMNTPLPYTLTVKAGGESRRDAQNRLSHRWYADVGRQLDGWDQEDARSYSKLHLGVAMLYAADDDFRAKWDKVVKKNLTYEGKLALMLEPFDFPVTRIMTVKQMTEYMERVHQHWSEQGVNLTNPEDLKWR